MYVPGARTHEQAQSGGEGSTIGTHAGAPRCSLHLSSLSRTSRGLRSTQAKVVRSEGADANASLGVKYYYVCNAIVFCRPVDDPPRTPDEMVAQAARCGACTARGAAQARGGKLDGELLGTLCPEALHGASRPRSGRGRRRPGRSPPRSGAWARTAAAARACAGRFGDGRVWLQQVFARKHLPILTPVPVFPFTSAQGSCDHEALLEVVARCCSR